jgi:hypothetical protein
MWKKQCIWVLKYMLRTPLLTNISEQVMLVTRLLTYLRVRFPKIQVYAKLLFCRSTMGGGDGSWCFPSFFITSARSVVELTVKGYIRTYCTDLHTRLVEWFVAHPARVLRCSAIGSNAVMDNSNNNDNIIYTCRVCGVTSRFSPGQRWCPRIDWREKQWRAPAKFVRPPWHWQWHVKSKSARRRRPSLPAMYCCFNSDYFNWISIYK